MGKKNKSVVGTSSSRKIVSDHSNIPEEQKRTWVIDETKDILETYNSLLDWIRFWGCKDGRDFDGIKKLAFVDGYPLIEVGVECGERLGKFLIFRGSLYIHAFYSRIRGWRIYDDSEIEILGEFTRFRMSVKYVGNPWARIGPRPMIEVLDNIDDENEEVASKGCQVFMVHLSEAARLLLVQSTVRRTLVPTPCNSWDPTKFFSEDNINLVGNDLECTDILNLLRSLVVDLSGSTNAPSQVQWHIKNFVGLSRIWFMYSLSQNKLYPRDVSLVVKCGIKSVLSLRHALSILSNTNLMAKVYKDCEKLVGDTFTLADFNLMRNLIESLEAPTHVFITYLFFIDEHARLTSILFI